MKKRILLFSAILASAGVTMAQNTFPTTGNVGVGTTSPDKQLTIKSDGTIGWEYTTVGSGSHHTIKAGGIDPMTFFVGPFSDPLRPIFNFNGHTNVPRLTILNGGAVGIGTTTPGTLFEVKGDLQSNWLTTFNNSNAIGHKMYFGYTNPAGTAYGLYIEEGANANYSRYLQCGADKFVVRGDGYVGIGTIEPTEKFHVYGGQGIIQSTSSSGGNVLTLRSEADNQGEFTGLSLDIAGGLHYGAIRSLVGPNGFSRLGLFTGDNAGNVLDEKLSILSNNGNVGIGTTAPDAKLDVYTNLPAQGKYNSQSWTTSNSGYNLKLETEWTNSGINYNFIQKFNNVDYNSLSFYNGRVGIGTTDPSANLQIGNSTQNGLINLGGYSTIGCLRSSGDLFAGRNVYAEYGSAAENEKLKVYQNSATGFSAMQMTYHGDINFYAKSGAVSVNEQANLDAYNVFKIAGDGTTYARELELRMDNFPDYVFEKEYPLMTLSEVETYIKANKHLPNVPSASELEKNGANVADLMKIQMEKIEELTLYLIEMKKADAELKKENEDIKKQLLILQNK